MNWARITNEEWREFQSIPEQGHSHRAWVDGAIRKRLDQLRTDEAVARLANFLHDDERQETLEEHEAWCKAPECEARQSYNKHARAAIDALIGEG